MARWLASSGDVCCGCDGQADEVFYDPETGYTEAVCDECVKAAREHELEREAEAWTKWAEQMAPLFEDESDA
jgi:hypothetical protein